jgi:hypothetical protein
MAPFRYTTQLHGRNIRLIKLEPGDGNQVSCSLEHVSLDDRPTYDAISYCWGHEDASFPILCNGATLLVRRNLYNALCHFQDHDNAVWLWVDAICINQANLQEKNEQVPLMGSIYSQANHVRVWLGREYYNPAEAVQTIKKLSSLARRYSEERNIPLSSLADSDYRDAWIIANGESELHRAELTGDWAPFVLLLTNPWFSCIWVIQEVALSRGKATLYSGQHVTLSWSELELALLFSNQCALLPQMSGFARLDDIVWLHRVVALVKTTVRFRTISASEEGSGLGLYWLLRTNHDALATDPRDMVFGLLGMAAKDRDERTGQATDIAADYGMEVAEVYQKVTEHFLVRFSTLTALSGAGLHYSGPLPSWVVYWDSRAPIAFFDPPGNLDKLYTTGIIDGYDACLASLHPKVAEVDGKILKLSGFILDEITECSTLHNPSKLHHWYDCYVSRSPKEFRLSVCLGLHRAAKVWRRHPTCSSLNDDCLNHFAHLHFATSRSPSLDSVMINQALLLLSRIGRRLDFLEKSPLGYLRLVLYASHKAKPEAFQRVLFLDSRVHR